MAENVNGEPDLPADVLGSAKARARGRGVRFLTPDDPGSVVLNQLRDKGLRPTVVMGEGVYLEVEQCTAYVLAQGAAAERARIVAWLRTGPPEIWANSGEAEQIADVIEWLAGDTGEEPAVPWRPPLPSEREKPSGGADDLQKDAGSDNLT